MNDEHYAAAGVDIKKADQLVGWLQEEKQIPSNNCQLISGLGSFAGAVRPKLAGYKDPILVASTDGIGTKVLLASEWDLLDNLGFDLVGMCVNDLYTIGASPLFFMDYYAAGVVKPSQFKRVLAGVRKALSACNTLLLGGETAELPGMFDPKHFDVAGFVVGMVDHDKILGAKNVLVGDVLLGFESNGFHSNGYSLLRQWVNEKAVDEGLQEKLLRGTHIYKEFNALLDVIPQGSIHALAHITGGGLSGNVERMIPENLAAHIDMGSVVTPDWMKELILDHVDSLLEVANVFNLGVGMVACVCPEQESRIIAAAKSQGLNARNIGYVAQAKKANDKRLELH